MKNFFRLRDKNFYQKSIKRASIGISSIAFASIMYTNQQNKSKIKNFWED
jgi:hypothetical protein